MKSFTARRWRNLVILIVLASVLVAVDRLSSLTLHRAPAVSGWMLFVLILGLTLYNIRKKLPFLPLGSSSAWLQIHIYTGLLSFVIFLLHIGWRLPDGVFEVAVALLYVTVFASGIVGLWMSREFAKRLTTRGEEIIFERIPRVRRRIHASVESLVVECLAETESTAIPEFYAERLKPYFERPQDFLGHLLQSGRRRKALLSELDAQRRYLNEQERQILDRIAEHIALKDDLDYQFTHQAMLKYWLFVHLPLTYALLVFAVFHVLLVHAYSGGVR